MRGINTSILRLVTGLLPAQTVTELGIEEFAETVDDADGDGVSEECGDNCPGIYNPDQVDSDDDGAGDLCDACPLDLPAEVSHVDADGDGVGDACGDNCLDLYNPDQADSDDDGAGDLCDACPLDDPVDVSHVDDDLDGVGDQCGDNCVGLYNPYQVNSDGDGFGDPGDDVEACEAPSGAVDQAGDCDDEDLGVRELASMMLNKDVEQLPVVNAGSITGMVFRQDIIRKLFGRA